MINCPRCGGANRDNARFCEFCGSSLLPEPKPQKPQQKEETGIELNFSLDYYKQYMDDESLYQMAIAKLNGILFKRDENEAIELLTYLAEREHIGAILTLAEICLKDATTKEAAINFLKMAADLGSNDALRKLHLLGVEHRPNKKPWFETPSIIDDENEKPEKPKNIHEIKEEVMMKTVLVKTVVLNSKKTLKTIGFIAEGGYIVTTYDAINRGAYTKITITMNGGDYQNHKVKIIRIVSRYNIVILKPVDQCDFDDCYDEYGYLETSKNYETGETVLCLGNIGMKLDLTKLKIIGDVSQQITADVDEAIKLSGKITKDVKNPILINAQGYIIGIVIKHYNGKVYALPSWYVDEVINNL